MPIRIAIERLFWRDPTEWSTLRPPVNVGALSDCHTTQHSTPSCGHEEFNKWDITKSEQAAFAHRKLVAAVFAVCDHGKSRFKGEFKCHSLLQGIDQVFARQLGQGCDVNESTTSSSNELFARNLRVACRGYRSVAEICRLAGINRQQFARYLNGAHRPSQHNLMRLCEVLGVSEADLDLSEEEFNHVMDMRSASIKYGFRSGWLGKELEKRVPVMDKSLWKYLGWYSSYSYSFGWPNQIIRSLVVLHRYKGRVFCKTIDRVRDPLSGKQFVYKTEGVVVMSAGKIFMAEQDALERDGFSFRILLPTPRSHVDYLTGLHTGTSHRSGRSPTAARLVLVYLGPSINLRRELNNCGIFEPRPQKIDPYVLSLIKNTLVEGETVLHPTTL